MAIDLPHAMSIYNKLKKIMDPDLVDKIYEEGNYRSWTNRPSGYRCYVLRPFLLGHLCGYVELPKSHKFYNKYYDYIPVSVHGGLTYSEDGVVGFDCAHAGDLIPSNDVNFEGDTYKDMKYVMRETDELAEQLFALTKVKCDMRSSKKRGRPRIHAL